MRVLALVILLTSLSGVVAAARQSSASRHDLNQSLNVALGVDCEHCHTSSNWSDATRPAFATAQRMMAMVAFLGGGPLAGTSGVSCWSCHRGQRRPSRIPTERWQQIQRDRFVGPLATQPDDVQLTMAVYSASLGVECGHCHVDGDWTSALKPAHATASRMSAMVSELPRFLPAGARTQCFMCHQGRTTPATAAPPRHIINAPR